MSDHSAIFLHCGLRLRSGIDLHLPTGLGQHVDVEVRWGDDIDDSVTVPPGISIAEFIDQGRRLYTAVRSEAGVVVRFPECGEFRIAPDLATVTVHRDRRGAHAGLLPVLMAGTVAAILHGLRGATLLHASAVIVDGGALAIVGRSGQGKSTLAALMCAEGFPLVTDDVLLVEPGPPVRCVGGASEIRLRPQSALLAGTHSGFRSRPTADDRTAVRPVDVETDRVPLAAIVVPSPSRDVSGLRVSRLPGMQSLLALLALPRIAGWTAPDVLERHFQTLGEVVDAVPVYTADVPWGPPFDPAVVHDLVTATSVDS